jgi:cytochrome c oxidase assembly factor CtaG/polyferredoxin
VADDFSVAVLQSWTISFWPTFFMLLTAVVYCRGWRLASALRPRELPAWRMLCFLLGLAVLWLAISSPLDALGQFLLVAHMTQHLLLMSVVPPLLLLGAPTVPILRGLPRFCVQEVFATWVGFAPFRAIGKLVTHPVFGWLAMNVAYMGWHLPAMYELALRSNDWHYVEHACFLFGSLLYWSHVIEPWPGKSTWSRWLIVPYIVAGDVVNSIISASLAFAVHVVYPTYATVPRIFEISALDDQLAAGAEMWVLSSMISFVPLVATVMQLLETRKHHAGSTEIAHAAKPVPAPFDLLRLPLVGSLLHARGGRLALQAVSFCGLLCVVAHGLAGTPLSPLNLSGGFLWAIARPLLFLLVLVVGNVFCMACPFTFPRELLRQFWTPRWRWPARLRSKWIALALTCVFFWSYLKFDLWNWPSATAWLLVAYVGCAFLVDALFEGASFCKYVCPIGQFNFATSLVAPLELRAKTLSVCASCSGRDCINGNQQQRGCELQLYMPQKMGNMDCTLCMDCVQACSHDNIQIAVHAPLRDLTSEGYRSSIGRYAQRVDVAALFHVLVLFALVNAAAMTAPVLQATTVLAQRFPGLVAPLISLLLFVLLTAAFLLLMAALSWLLRGLTLEKSSREVFGRMALVLLPVGLSMWVAHLLFHLTTAGDNLLPAFDQFLLDFGVHAPLHTAASVSAAMGAMCSPQMLMLTSGGGGTNLLSLQVWILDVGLLLGLYVAWRMLRPIASSRKEKLLLLLVATLLAATYYAAAVWVFNQPMQMLGMGGQ